MPLRNCTLFTPAEEGVIRLISLENLWMSEVKAAHKLTANIILLFYRCERSSKNVFQEIKLKQKIRNLETSGA